MRQTSIEWLIEQISYKEPSGQSAIDLMSDEEIDAICDKAVEMHTKEVTDACIEASNWGRDSSDSESTLKMKQEWAQEYYFKTYGGNQ